MENLQNILRSYKIYRIVRKLKKILQKQNMKNVIKFFWKFEQAIEEQIFVSLYKWEKICIKLKTKYVILLKIWDLLMIR